MANDRAGIGAPRTVEGSLEARKSLAQADRLSTTCIRKPVAVARAVVAVAEVYMLLNN